MSLMISGMALDASVEGDGRFPLAVSEEALAGQQKAQKKKSHEKQERAPKRLTEAQKALAEQHWMFANSIAKTYVKKWPRYRSDIYSAANYGLVMSALRYDAETGNRFMTFAWYRINGAIQDFLDSVRQRGREWRFLDDRDSLEDRLSPLTARLNPLIAVDSWDEFEGLISRLSEELQRFAILVFRDGYGVAPAAEAMGLSKTKGYSMFDRVVSRVGARLGR